MKETNILDKIEKLEKAVERYEKLLAKSKENLAKLKAKQREDDVKELCEVLLKSGKSVDEIKSLLG